MPAKPGAPAPASLDVAESLTRLESAAAGPEKQDALSDEAGSAAITTGTAATGLPGRALADGSVAYRVEKGDTLSTIAQRGYGRASDWKRILDANAATLKGNEKALRPGAEIIVPGPVSRIDGVSSTAVATVDLDRMARVLERRLLAIALYERLPAEDRAKLPPLEVELSRLVVGCAIEVIVRADAGAALDALAASGLRVNRLETPKVDGALAQVTVPVQRLQEVALMPGIRAICPAGK